MEWIMVNWIGFDKDDNEQKALMFAEAMIFMDVSEDIYKLDAEEVKSKFQKKAMFCHPDRIPADASEETKNRAKQQWHCLEMAEKVLLAYCQDRGCLSASVKDRISVLWKENTKVDIEKLKLKLERNTMNAASRGVTDTSVPAHH